MFGRMEKGTLVEYIDRQRIICAVVLENRGKRLRLLSENDRDVNLAERRLLHVSADRIDLEMGRDRLVAVIRQRSAHRKRLSDQVDVAALWDVLWEEAAWVDVATMAGLAFPLSPTSDHLAAVVRAFFGNRIFFKFEPDRFRAYSPEQVEQIRAKAHQAEIHQQLTEQGGKWLSQVKNNPAALKPSVKKLEPILKVLRSYFLFEKESPHAAIGKAMLAKAEIPSTYALFPILVQAGVFKPNENLPLIRSGIDVAFSAQVQSTAEQMAAGADTTESGARQDLTDLPVITIDGTDTRDFDDGLSLEKIGSDWRVGIHIVDVGQFVARDSLLDITARQRGSSIYMPDQRIAMLPLSLSEKACSLIQGQVRPAISVLAHITLAGRVVDWQVVPSNVCVRHQLTYAQVQADIDSHPQLQTLFELAKQFRRFRHEQEAVQITLPEVIVRTDGDQQLELQRNDRENPGRLLVAEWMILANWLMARYLHQCGLPAIYRSQPAPKQRLYRGSDGTLFQNWMQRRLVRRFTLGVQPQKHTGLGLEVYATATSPIRKYLDLIVQRQLRASFGFEPAYTADEIKQHIDEVKPVIQQVALLQRSRHRYWILKHLESKIGRIEAAMVLFRRRNVYQILLPQYMIECELPVRAGLKLKAEETIEVTIQRVDARQDSLAVFL